MVDISTPEFADKINTILSTANQDESFKRALLTDPISFLKQQGLDLQDYLITVEENKNYGLYFALQHHKIQHKSQAPAEKNSQQHSFKDQHFMDCHHH